MAKLPQIQYRQVSLPSQPGPGSPVAEANQIARGVDTLTRGLTSINNATREFDSQAASVDAQNNLATWERDNAGREVWTAQEVKDAGLEDKVNMYQGVDEKGDPIERKLIPRHEVYPYAQQRAMESIISSSGNMINNPLDKRNWTRDMTARSAEASAKTMGLAERDAIAWTHKEQEVKILEAQGAGNFEGASDLIDARYVNPGLKAEANAANKVKEEEWKLSTMLMTEDIDELNEALDYMSSDKFASDSVLSRKQQNAYYGAAINRKNSMLTQQKAQQKINQDFATTEALTGIETNTVTKADLINSRHAYGLSNYKFLIGQVEAKATGKTFQTDDLTMANFERSVLEFQSGKFGQSEYDDGVNMLEDWVLDNAVLEDPITGERVVKIGDKDINIMRTRLEMLKQEPYKTEPYLNLVKDISVRIRGGSGDLVQIGPQTPEINNRYQEALNSVRNFVNENGGTRADLDVWRKQNYPTFLKDVALLSLLQVPRGVRGSVVYNSDNTIDKVGTQTDLANTVTNAVSDTAKKAARQDVAKFDDWVKRQGIN
jgi:hypothetical protein